MKSKIITSILSIFLITSFGLFCACSSSNNQQKSESSLAEVSFGTKTESSNTLYLKNTTGKKITKVNAKISRQERIAKLKSSGEEAIWGHNKIAEIYLEKIQESSTKESDNDIVLKATYDLIFIFEDNTSAEIHNLAQSGLDEYKDASLSINSSDQLAYISYTDPTGKTINTLNTEQQILNDKKAQEKAQTKTKEKTTNNSNSSNYHIKKIHKYKR